MTTLTLQLLPERKTNYRALLAAFVSQSIVVVALIHFGVIKPDKVVLRTKNFIYTPLLQPNEPVLPQPRIRTYAAPVVANLAVPKPFSAVRIPAAVVDPARVELQAKAPVLPIVSAPLPK